MFTTERIELDNGNVLELKYDVKIKEAMSQFYKNSQMKVFSNGEEFHVNESEVIPDIDDNKYRARIESNFRVVSELYRLRAAYDYLSLRPVSDPESGCEFVGYVATNHPDGIQYMEDEVEKISTILSGKIYYAVITNEANGSKKRVSGIGIYSSKLDGVLDAFPELTNSDKLKLKEFIGGPVAI